MYRFITIVHQFTFLRIKGALIGFTNIGDVNAQLETFEKSLEGDTAQPVLADHMLVLMVCPQLLFLHKSNTYLCHAGSWTVLAFTVSLCPVSMY